MILLWAIILALAPTHFLPALQYGDINVPANFGTEVPVNRKFEQVAEKGRLGHLRIHPMPRHTGQHSDDGNVYLWRRINLKAACKRYYPRQGRLHQGSEVIAERRRARYYDLDYLKLTVPLTGQYATHDNPISHGWEHVRGFDRDVKGHRLHDEIRPFVSQLLQRSSDPLIEGDLSRSANIPGRPDLRFVPSKSGRGNKSVIIKCDDLTLIVGVPSVPLFATVSGNDNNVLREFNAHDCGIDLLGQCEVTENNITKRSFVGLGDCGNNSTIRLLDNATAIDDARVFVSEDAKEWHEIQ